MPLDKESNTKKTSTTSASKKATGSNVRKKTKRAAVPRGIVHIQTTFNNIIVTITDPAGNPVSWGAAGVAGFKGSRKNTPYAAQKIAGDAAMKAREFGMREVVVVIRGPGAGRESALRALEASGMQVISISDVTPIPHNGCRPPKRRRV